MRLSTLREELQRRVAPMPDSAADHAARAALSVLAAALPGNQRQALREAVPESMRAALEQPYQGPELSEAELVETLARIEQLPEGRALELATVVYAALAAALDADTRARLCRHLPDTLARYLQVPDAPHPHRPQHASHARPTHGGSVANWDGSRDDQTLGGYRGDPRDRDGDTLATGKPGSKRKLGD